jgi:hypothetical protein
MHTLTSLYYELMHYYENELKSRTIEFAVPSLEALCANDGSSEERHKRTLVHMNSFVLAVVLQQPNSLEHFRELPQEQQKCLGESMMESGASQVLFDLNKSVKSNAPPKTAETQ